MQDQDGQYKPQDKNSDLDDLVCPKCGIDVPKEQYNEVTQLIKCQDCGNIFVFSEKEEIEGVQISKIFSSEDAIKNKPKTESSLFLVFTLLLLTVLILWLIRSYKS